MKFKIGDRVGTSLDGVVEIGEIASTDGAMYWVVTDSGYLYLMYEKELFYINDSSETVVKEEPKVNWVISESSNWDPELVTDWVTNDWEIQPAIVDNWVNCITPSEANNKPDRWDTVRNETDYAMDDAITDLISSDSGVWIWPKEVYDRIPNVSPTGGPSSYYDFNPKWETLNDLMDEKAEKQWKEHTHYLHNIMKAAFRWGAKDGTTRGYDARKIIYYAFRILRSLEGREAVQKELKSLQEDTQFKV